MSRTELGQFWYEVEQAFHMVELNHELEIIVARDKKQARVFWEDDIYPPGGFVGIHIREADTEVKEPLPVP